MGLSPELFLILGLILLLFGAPLLAVATERSQGRLSVPRFLLRVLVLGACSFFVFFFSQAIPWDYLANGQAHKLSFLMALILAECVLIFFCFRFIVQRARDAGYGKKLAYLAVVPGLNALVIIPLLIKGSRPIAETPELKDQ